MVVDNIPVTLKDLSDGIVNDGLNTIPSNLTNSLMFLNPWLPEVVISSWPVKWLNDAVLIPNAPPVVAIPTIPTIAPLPFVVAFTFAPAKFATPNPPVEPNDTITPPLGSWFWFTSVSLIIFWPFDEVIPVNTILLAPPTSLNS